MWRHRNDRDERRHINVARQISKGYGDAEAAKSSNEADELLILRVREVDHGRLGPRAGKGFEEGRGIVFDQLEQCMQDAVRSAEARGKADGIHAEGGMVEIGTVPEIEADKFERRPHRGSVVERSAFDPAPRPIHVQPLRIALQNTLQLNERMSAAVHV